MHLKIVLLLLLAVYTSQKHLSGTNKTAEFLAKTQLELLKKAANETNLARMSKLASIDIETLDNVGKLFRLVTILEFSVLDAAAVGNKDIYAMIESWINSWPSRIVYTEDSPYFARILFEHSPTLFKSFTFLGVAFVHIQSWSSIVICINKLRTANPEKYEERNKFWNRWCLLIYGLIIAFGLLAANYLIVIPTIRYLPETGNFVFIVMNLGDGIVNIFLVGVFLILYILISLIIGLVTICKIRKHEDKGYHHSSLVILAHTFFRVFCLLSLIGSFFLQIEDFTVEMMITIFDFMTFSMTYMLLFCDENVKMALRTSCSSGDSTE